MGDGMAYNQSLGKCGEKLAVDYMVKEGYEIIATNYRNRCGEIDIVASLGETIVFCEVKTRTSLKYGRPALAVNQEKRRHIIRVAQCFLSSGEWEDFYPRFDVVEIYRLQETIINHMTNAYQQEEY